VESLSEHVVAFSRELRDCGLGTAPASTLDAARSAGLIGVGDLPAFRAALRANLTVSVDDFEAFDRAFDRFWLGRSIESAQPPVAPRMTTIDNRPQGPTVYMLAPVSLEGISPEGDARLPGGERTAGETDVLTRKDFRDVSAADLPRMRRLIQQLAPRLASVPSRRTAPSHGRGRIDLRRTVREARRHGGEVVELSWQRPKLRKLRVVALCDVSGSMDRYSQHLLQFFHALQLESGGVRTFVFSTRLRDVSAVLRRRQFADVLAGLSARVETWSGGTTIGACLKEFNLRQGKELLGPRTVVIIASDGWERGDAEQLRRELAHIRARARRVIWLNPLKARAGYEPLAAGMAAALPYLDAFLPAASLADLERLKRVLAHG
jgi:uncharacterized protein